MDKLYRSEQQSIIHSTTIDGKNIAKTRTYLLKGKFGIVIVIQRLILADLKEREEIEICSYKLVKIFRDQGLFESKISFTAETLSKIIEFLTVKTMK